MTWKVKTTMPEWLKEQPEIWAKAWARVICDKPVTNVLQKSVFGEGVHVFSHSPAPPPLPLININPSASENWRGV